MVQWLSHSCQSSCFQLQKARVWIQQVDKDHLFGVNCIKRQNKEKPVGFFNKVCSNSQSLKLFFQFFLENATRTRTTRWRRRAPPCRQKWSVPKRSPKTFNSRRQSFSRICHSLRSSWRLQSNVKNGFDLVDNNLVLPLTLFLPILKQT